MEILYHDEVKVFIKSLEKPSRSKILRGVDLIEKYGSHVSMPHVRKVTHVLWELRIRGQQEVRILFVMQDDRAVLLHGFKRKRKKHRSMTSRQQK